MYINDDSDVQCMIVVPGKIFLNSEIRAHDALFDYSSGTKLYTLLWYIKRLKKHTTEYTLKTIFQRRIRTAS